jgi:uncharacterized membrane protein
LSDFTGRILAYGGLLTTALAVLLFLLINLNFSSAFDSFHKLFFQQGTYTFDSQNEIIVNLYPEEAFMGLGLRISKWVFIASAISMSVGTSLIAKAKTKRIKNSRTNQK